MRASLTDVQKVGDRGITPVSLEMHPGFRDDTGLVPDQRPKPAILRPSCLCLPVQVPGLPSPPFYVPPGSMAAAARSPWWKCWHQVPS